MARWALQKALMLLSLKVKLNKPEINPYMQCPNLWTGNLRLPRNHKALCLSLGRAALGFLGILIRCFTCNCSKVEYQYCSNAINICSPNIRSCSSFNHPTFLSKAPNVRQYIHIKVFKHKAKFLFVEPRVMINLCSHHIPNQISLFEKQRNPSTFTSSQPQIQPSTH